MPWPELERAAAAGEGTLAGSPIITPSPNSEPRGHASQRPRTRAWHRPFRVLYVVSHPIPYQEPLLRRLARCPRIDLSVRFLSDFSVGRHTDQGFGGSVDWKTSLAQGYRSTFATRGTEPPNRFTGTLGNWVDTIDKMHFDAVWLHGYHHLANWRGAAIAKRRGVPLILRGETAVFDQPTPRSKWRTRLLRHVTKSADALLAIGSANARFWQSHGAAPDRVFFVPYAVDNAWFRSRAEIARPRRTALRQELGLHPERPVVLYNGKLQARKRVADFIQAAAVAGRRLAPIHRPQILISGAGPDRARLEELAEEHGEDASIRFLGFQAPHALPRLYDLATCIVLPSAHEPWGLVVNEAMACGTAAIVSDVVGAGPDLVLPGRTGFITGCGDIGALARHIELVCGDPKLADRMGRNARQHIDAFSFAADERGILQALERVTS